MAFLRSQGMRTVIYLDDILVLAENKEDLVLQVHQVTTLLEQLGFTINIQKSSLEPAHLITYLGVVVDSVTMKFLLTEEKVQQISNICKQALAAQKVSAQDLSSIVGKLVAARSAILPAPIHVRQLQFQLIQTLRASRSYRTQITLSKESQQELQWWIYKLHEWNGRDILPTPPDLLIQSDASLQGWGAVCNGTRTGGHWSAEERHQHINNLELQAGAFAVQTFTKGMGNIQVLLQMDNRSAVTYINKMGGTHSLTLSLQACNLWCWCLERNIHLSAEYGELNSRSGVQRIGVIRRVDAAQRSLPTDSADTGPMQDRPVCNQAEPPAAELYQLEARSVCSGDRCTPPRLEDVGGVRLSPILLDREMSTEDSPGEKHHNDSSAMVVLPSMLLESLVDLPLLLPNRKDFLFNPAGHTHPLVDQGHLQLAACRVSGDNMKRQVFLDGLQSSFLLDGAKRPTQPTNLVGQGGPAGVINGKSIPFHVASSHFSTSCQTYSRKD